MLGAEISPLDDAAGGHLGHRALGDRAAPAASTTTRSATRRTSRRLCSTTSSATPRLLDPVDDRGETVELVGTGAGGQLVHEQDVGLRRERGGECHQAPLRSLVSSGHRRRPRRRSSPTTASA